MSDASPDPSAGDLLAFIEASPSPRHCVAEAVRRLTEAGFEVHRGGPEGTDLPDRGFEDRAGALVAWVRGDASKCRVITAHTDSPNLRIKPRPDTSTAGFQQLGVEVYGGALVNSWLDRDLGLAGHLVHRNGNDIVERLVRVDRPVLRIPQLAIHLDREINTKGLQLNKQQHLSPTWGLTSGDDVDEERCLRSLLADEFDLEPDAILSYELMAFDTLAPAVTGWHGEFIASARIDNQLSCWAAVTALIESDATHTTVIALFDHEEVGSVSATGADSHLLATRLDDLVAPSRSTGSGSLCISADCAHATHPNYPDRHEPEHKIQLNAGPVIKINANERYATTAMGHALFAAACDEAGVPHQVFVNRTDLACGSTVGPITAARTGLETVDVGAPQLAMHSAREMTGSADPGHLARALTRALEG